MNREALLQRIVQTTGDLPTLPPVANMVLDKLSDPDASVKQLHEIISRDQSLAARILKIANSSFYGCSRNITKVSDAIVIIGFKSIKSLILTTVLQDFLKNFGLTEKLLWEHSLGCALGARIIAKTVKFSKIEEAFLSGLLHDLGKVVINLKLPQQMSIIIQDVYNHPGTTFLDIEQKTLGFDHAQVGQLVAQKWNFAEEIDEAIGTHHNPRQAQLMPVLACIIQLADGLANKLEIGPSRSPDLDLMSLDAVKFLRLNADSIDQLLGETEEAFNSQQDIFST